MAVILSLLLVLIFGTLSSVHMYWALGGRWGIENAAPVNEGGKKFLNTGVMSSFVVAVGLALFGAYYIIQPAGLLAIAGWIIPSIFFIRAIGDFRYVGFFKRVKSSTFARLDTKFYSPLCLVIAVSGYGVEMLN